MATSAAGRIRVRFACSVCGLALTSGIAVAQTENFALPAAAQQTSPQLVEAQNDSSSGDQSGLVKPGNDIEAIEVSASRINIAGYEQPTPVTVVSAQQLDQA